jgi:glyoxylase-like metal-dependent hydrolase (beta-lactamase superfamily II)
VRLGELDLRPVSDGRFRLDGGMMFGVVPRVLWAKRMAPDEANRVELELNCLLVRGPGFTALIDTGLGTNLSDKEKDRVWGLEPGPRLLDNLASIGVQPEDVDLVVNTHLHIDHCGGNSVRRDGRLAPAFPRARYVVQRREWEDAMAPNERTKTSYLPELLKPIADAGLLQLLDGEAQVNEYLRCLPTPGHTPGHQSVLLSAGDQRALFLGDVAPFAAHCERLAWVPAIDVLPLETMESKRELLPRAADEGYLLIFYHEKTFNGARLSRDGDGYRLTAEPLV